MLVFGNIELRGEDRERKRKRKEAYLDIDATYLDVEVLRQNAHLYGPAPGIRGLDPAAVVVGALLQHNLGVDLRLGLDRAGDEGTQLRHAEIVAWKDGCGERPEETAVVIGHYSQY